MSQLVKSGRDLHELLKVKDKTFVLFYASWCPFSLRFLPIFGQQAKADEQNFVRMIIDQEQSLCEKYSVAVCPVGNRQSLSRYGDLCSMPLRPIQQ
jgi:thiol-disulfide isomerase/thioredoxin